MPWKAFWGDKIPIRFLPLARILWNENVHILRMTWKGQTCYHKAVLIAGRHAAWRRLGGSVLLCRPWQPIVAAMTPKLAENRYIIQHKHLVMWNWWLTTAVRQRGRSWNRHKAGIWATRDFVPWHFLAFWISQGEAVGIHQQCFHFR